MPQKQVASAYRHSAGVAHAMPTSTSACVAGHEGALAPMRFTHGAAPRIAQAPMMQVATSSHARSGAVPYSQARPFFVHGVPGAGSAVGQPGELASEPPLDEEEEEEDDDEVDVPSPLDTPVPIPVRVPVSVPAPAPPSPPPVTDDVAPPHATTIPIPNAAPTRRVPFRIIAAALSNIDAVRIHDCFLPPTCAICATVCLPRATS
jgi:hypothetical protein